MLTENISQNDILVVYGGKGRLLPDELSNLSHKSALEELEGGHHQPLAISVLSVVMQPY